MGKTKHNGPVKLDTSLKPSLWASMMPMGLGKIKPHHILDTMKVVYDNRDNLGYAYRILTQGVCDGCALGVSGLYDQTLTGPHLCTTRLNVLRLNTMPAMEPKWLENVSALRELSSVELRKLGRIPYPLSRKPGENKFTRISWNDALDRIAKKIKGISPKQLAFFLTARGITNEVYYTAAKMARFLGTNNIDNASRICHSPSKTALKRSMGIGASSCNYQDWIGTDVLVFFGSVPANNQPVSTKYMYAAKKAGTKIILINPYKEPAMEQYWIPSVPESAVFGTKLADDFYQVNIGGDIAFMNGVMKHWFEMEQANPGSAINHEFVREHANGIEELRAHLQNQSWEALEKSSGVSKERLKEFALLLANSKSGVFVWSMGLTQHRFGTDNISSVANLAILRGFFGRKHCGVMPIRGHSGVQGSGEMGADPFSLPGGDFDEKSWTRIEKLWNFPIPKWQGDIVGVSLENALLPDGHERKTRLFYTSGGNFLETMPDPDFMRTCLESVELRVHQDIIFNTSTLVDAKEEVIVLPAMTRYEQPGGGTSTSTERMVYFSAEIEGPRIEEARPEWEIYVDLAARVHPNKKHLMHFASAAEIRAEIAKANPNYDGIQHLKNRGDVFQWGGAWLCEDGVCPTPDGKANLLPIDIPELHKPDGHFYVTTRRGKQFNSMIYSNKDPFNNADRYDILINPQDARELRIAEGESIVVYNSYGTFQGRAKFEETKRGNIQVYWPEGNVLIPKGVYEAYAGIPEYNTAVKIEKADTFTANKDLKYKERPVEDLDVNVG
ncbi:MULTISPECIES: FdhF/YdeP family oxidoreductase [Brevibacillus]|uniref:FdhF/YdeP family oxidoreductase n=1 Tax=Brevibacillus TaxID=55080 RepID=UPI00156ADD7A|nr:MULTISPECIES: FdhF/YdeP family oxidoreductase [Brevibacillus]MBU8712584.1 FdhF/YdeP family oxidoreductase [Brevibacillus parabrevis]MDR5000207.1 FdhF/YdeP family oxidoreductase [Brevibacillus parabrevis]MED1725955.1 FdhF/YdeP family oxidoreductase [Brevibacillus parabrevis]NRQ52609.1 FdhF/YdeP family oxidoreductase [Brevibacillus sp. HD1.4A]UED70163.1 FdhF/YdeP family oxidoreductase [Brevibacillus sp. HD3.3A]